MNTPDSPTASYGTASSAAHRRLLAEALGEKLQSLGWRVATAESCTGGGIAAALTEIPGSSAWFEYGLVTYANDAKQRLLGVSEETLATGGAVSEAVVRQMATGAIDLSGSELAVAVSGVAGPDGGSPDKPVGTVWLGWACKVGEAVKTGASCHHFEGSREQVREQAVVAALEALLAVAAPQQTTV